jgi:leader peptidase (prepilin peptidase) / N-methyltransferase
MEGPGPVTLVLGMVLCAAGIAIACQPWLLKRLVRLWHRDQQARALGLSLGPLRRTWGVAGLVVLLSQGGLFAWVWSIGHDGPELLILAGLGGITLVLALIDWRSLWLPHRVVMPLIALGIAASLAWGDPWFWPLLGSGIGYGLFALLRLGYQRLRGIEGLGGGDVPLAGAMGAWLGPLDLPIALFLAAILGLLAALVLFTGPERQRARLPFGSFLSLALFAGVCLRFAGV